MKDMNTSEKWSQAIRGVAYGDAWANDNEFQTYAQLTSRNARGPELPDRLIITDDTQMTLSLARGLHEGMIAARLCASRDADVRADIMRTHVLDEWRTWYHDKDNNRAPGVTTLQACAKLDKEVPWHRATVVESDTCGAVMRVAPVSFLATGWWQPMAAWQAASTHGGPTAIASSIIATAVIRRAIQGMYLPPGELIDAAIDFTQNIAARYFIDWILEHPLADESWDAAVALIELGLVHVREALQVACTELRKMRKSPWSGDPSQSLPGWRSHHALACALLCADLFPDDPVAALRRATVTGGDSDSIAAIAGAVLGALHSDPWPSSWFERLEPRYQAWIESADYYEFAKDSGEQDLVQVAQEWQGQSGAF